MDDSGQHYLKLASDFRGEYVKKYFIRDRWMMDANLWQ